MYLKRITYCNVGPLRKVNIEPSFNEKDMPKPLVLVGENGSGKTTFLSNIVDSFYEIAGSTFSNVRKKDEETTSNYLYYKTISKHQISVGEKNMYSHVVYQHENRDIEYVFKSGDISLEEFKEREQLSFKDRIDWGNNNNYKGIFYDNKDDIETIFEKDVICCFDPNRYDRPAWMGNSYYELSQNEHIVLNEKWSGKLNNYISADAITESNIQWLLDVIIDSRPDIVANDGGVQLDGQSMRSLPLLSQARNNVEKIMSSILSENVSFKLNYRFLGADRFKVVNKRTAKTIAPTLNSLSTGQLALFNMFATIVKYGDGHVIKHFSSFKSNLKLSCITFNLTNRCFA